MSTLYRMEVSERVFASGMRYIRKLPVFYLRSEDGIRSIADAERTAKNMFAGFGASISILASQVPDHEREEVHGR